MRHASNDVIMKSPTDISLQLTKQWHRTPIRVDRLLSGSSWPLQMPIGKPSGAQFASRITEVQAHVQRWRAVNVGQVIWDSVNYQASARPVLVPLQWCLRSPSEWVAATADETVKAEFSALEQLAEKINPIYRDVLIRERSLWRNKNYQEVVTASQLADRLYPGFAEGKPLRLLNGLGVDTKFFERHYALLSRLLDQRFDGEASEQGLNNFLDAHDDKNHWLLVAPLGDKLLPFKQQRVTAEELSQTRLPGSHVLVIENEQCLHLLPRLPGTIAILGAGLNLQWLKAATFDDKQLAYWGDMDTWGLLMLGRARLNCPELYPVLMSRRHFDHYSSGCAVPEPSVAQEATPEGLSPSESEFYRYISQLERGRLEQEYLPEKEVHRELKHWSALTTKKR